MEKKIFIGSQLEKEVISRYGCDRIMMLATVSKDLVPRLRVVDLFWHDGAIYTVGHAKTRKVEDILVHPVVTLQNGWDEFVGTAQNIGHPLKEENKEIREVFIKMLSWYFDVNDESDPDTCFIKITPQKGIFDDRLNKKRYMIDLANNQYEETWFNDHVASRIEMVF